MPGHRAVAILALAALAACRKTDHAASTTAARATSLSLLPAETLLVISVDLARLRKAPLMAKLSAANPLPPPLVQLLDAVAAKSGIDLAHTFDSVVVAGGSQRKWAVVARAQRLDGARLETAVQQALRDRGGELVTEKRGTRTLWSARGEPNLEAVLLDERTLVVGAGGWTEQIAALAGGATTTASAASNAALAKLCQGVSDRPIWGAAIVSEQLRDEWLDNLQTQEAAYLDRVTVSVDVDTGLDAKLTAVLTEAAQAEELAEELAEWLVRARQGDQSGSMFQALLKGVTTYTDGSAVHVNASLGEAPLVHWAGLLSRYWRIVGAGLPQPSQRATPLKLAPEAGTKSGLLALGDARVFTDWENNRYAIVEVTNRTTRSLAPALQLLFRRRSGDAVAPGHCTVQVGVLQPGEKAVCVGLAPPAVVSANYDVHLLDAQPNETRIALKLLAAQLGPPLGPLQWVGGRVRNETRSVLERPQVHVTFYDASGKLVGYGRDSFDGKPLQPGSEATFQASSMVIMPATATSFAISAFGLSDKR